MCGIVGFFAKSMSNERQTQVALRMLEVLNHRGPDDAQYWNNSEGLLLGHARLAILDLSDKGRQPMTSSSGRYVIVYNGELYNHKEIRTFISQDSSFWRGDSDTETLLALVEKVGLSQALKKISGMFAFCLLDKKDQKVYLARDRTGEKPLYYGLINGSFVFGSELKPFKYFPDFRFELDILALKEYVRLGYVPRDLCILKGFKKLLPGNVLSVNLEDLMKGGLVEDKFDTSEYWSFNQVINDGKRNLFQGDFEEAVEELDLRLTEAVSQQMISDVPLGAFLSGGIDSSSIVSIMQKISSKPVKTFSIGFEDPRYNEAGFARSVAIQLGTEHHSETLDVNTTLNVVPELPEIYDEPFADESQIPTVLVSRIAKKNVTVSLSGDGGDELFCGYNRYHIAKKIFRWPKSFRLLGSLLLDKVSPEQYDILYESIGRIVRLPSYSQVGDKIHKLKSVIANQSADQVYDALLSHWDPDALVSNQTVNSENILKSSILEWESRLTEEENMMKADSLMYLPDDILVKVDRAAMSTSLETRVPFLDPNLIKFAWSLPLEYKSKGSGSKLILKSMLSRYIAPDTFERPKMGFGVPIGDWLRGPLLPWANSLLEETSLNIHGLFNNNMISQAWKQHQEGSRNWQAKLWIILSFQAWYMKHKQEYDHEISW